MGKYLCIGLFLISQTGIAQDIKKISKGLELDIISDSIAVIAVSVDSPATYRHAVYFTLQLKNNNDHAVSIPAEYRENPGPGRGVGNISFELIYLSDDVSPNCVLRGSQCVFGNPRTTFSLSGGKSYFINVHVEGFNFIRKGEYKIRFYSQPSYFYSELPDISTNWRSINVGDFFSKYCK